MFEDEVLEASPFAHGSLPSPKGISSVDDRLSQMVDQLSAQHSAMLSRGVSLQATFDEQVARATFTTRNVNNFVQAFFRFFYDEHHLFYRPSFSVHTTSFPLLLAVVLLGSMSSSQSDVSIALQQFFDVAEEYVFGRLALKSTIPCTAQEVISNDDVELYQAGILFMILLNNNSNLAVRRRIRLQRHSSLIAAVRNSGLFSYKRRDPSSAKNDCLWELVVEDEARIRYGSPNHDFVSHLLISDRRIGAWAFMMDSAVAIFFNTAPQVALSEMTGDLPCEDEIFHAKSLSNQECIAFLERQAMAGSTVRDLTLLLLSTASETPALDEAFITAETMLILMTGNISFGPALLNPVLTYSALHSFIMTSRANFMQDAVVEYLICALDRWKRLWDAKNKPAGAGVVLHKGFQRHAPEYWWLAKSLLKALQLRDDGCRYMQPMPSDSMQPLHDFVRRYKDLAE